MKQFSESELALALLDSMQGTDYKDRVIALFQGGSATPEQWQAMACAVLRVSEGKSSETVWPIDQAIITQRIQSLRG